MISNFFINRPIVAMVIAIITVLGGLIAMLGLPLAQFPEIVPPQIVVSTTYTGADAVTIEQSISTPLEQQMNGVDNMLYMQSTNANDGTEQLFVTFDVETDVNIDQVNVQNRIAQAQPNLPADVVQYGITTRKSTGLPMLVISLYSPNRTHDSLFLANYANININDVLYRVPGVGQVQLFGASDYAMRIWVQPDVLARLSLSVPDLANAVRQQSTVNPSGQVGGAPGPAGLEKTYTVRAQGRLQTPEEFGQIVVRSLPDGSVVRLKDVARIELGALNYQQSSRMNGQPAAVVAIFQTPGSNAIAVADGVKKSMEELKGRFPAGPGLHRVARYDAGGDRGNSRDRVHAHRGPDPCDHRRLCFPAELAGDADPDDRRSGIADRHIRRVSLYGILDQHAVALRFRAGDWPRGRRCDCRRGSGSTPHRARHAATGGHVAGDEGGFGACDRHCADPRFSLPARGIHGRHPGTG